MNKNLVLQLRYVGVTPQSGHREYRFRIEDKQSSVREVVLTIDDTVFRDNQLMFQEAPDLCYQKMLQDLGNETAESPISSRAAVTSAEIADYRDSHPTSKTRRSPPSRKRPE